MPLSCSFFVSAADDLDALGDHGPGIHGQIRANDGRDVGYETDFRSVYARVLDDWLGVDSTAILGDDFRNGSVDFI